MIKGIVKWNTECFVKNYIYGCHAKIILILIIYIYSGRSITNSFKVSIVIEGKKNELRSKEQIEADTKKNT